MNYAKGTLFSINAPSGKKYPCIITSFRHEKLAYALWNGYSIADDSRRWIDKDVFQSRVADGSITIDKVLEPSTPRATVRLNPRQCEDLFAEAHKAGLEAAERTTPQPMVVQQHSNPLNDNSPVVKQYFVPQGLCGFAWIKVRPGTSSFAKWLKRTNRGYLDSYEGGVNVWVSVGGQSYEIKMAYAQAFASVLQAVGIQAIPQGRLD